MKIENLIHKRIGIAIWLPKTGYFVAMKPVNLYRLSAVN